MADQLLAVLHWIKRIIELFTVQLWAVLRWAVMNWKPITEVVAILIALGLLVVTIVQTRHTEQAVRIATDSAHADQRAWVGPAAPPTVTGLDWSAGKGRYVLTIKNFGKSPALRFTAPYVIHTDPRGIIGSQDASCDSSMYEKDEAGKWGRVLWPGERKDVAEFKGLPEASAEIGTPSVIFISGCVTYRDMFNHFHWTRFCYENIDPTLPDQEFRPCAQYNYTDDLEKSPPNSLP